EVPINFNSGLPFSDSGVPGQPPATGTTSSYFAPLQLLNPALAPFLQKVEIGAVAGNTSRVDLTNNAPLTRELSYDATDQLTMQLADPSFPAIGPFSGPSVSHTNSLNIPSFLLVSDQYTGSNVDDVVSFVGSDAQKFVGDGLFDLEFFSALSLALSG